VDSPQKNSPHHKKRSPPKYLSRELDFTSSYPTPHLKPHKSTIADLNEDNENESWYHAPFAEHENWQSPPSSPSLMISDDDSDDSDENISHARRLGIIY
jgi:hypothetical protein